MNIEEQNKVMREALEQIGNERNMQPISQRLASESIAAIGPAPEQGQDERALFESEMRKTWGKEHFKMVSTPFDGICYISISMSGAWAGWQAARAQQPASPPSAASITPEQPAADSVDTPVFESLVRQCVKDLPSGYAALVAYIDAKLAEARQAGRIKGRQEEAVEVRAELAEAAAMLQRRAETAEADFKRVHSAYVAAENHNEVLIRKLESALAAQVPQAGQAPVIEQMRGIVAEIRAAKTMAWRDSLFDKIVGLIDASTPAPEPVKRKKASADFDLPAPNDAIELEPEPVNQDGVLLPIEALGWRDATKDAPMKQDGQAVDWRALVVEMVRMMELGPETGIDGGWFREAARAIAAPPASAAPVDQVKK